MSDLPADVQPPGSEPPVQTGPPEGHPRWQEVVSQRDEARQQLATVQQQIAALTQAAEQERARAAQVTADLALAEYGLVDPQARVVARALHGTLPETDRPDLPAWVASLRSDPTAAPVALRGYLSPAAPAVAAPPSGSAVTPPPAAVGLPASAAPAAQAAPPPASPHQAVQQHTRALEIALRQGDRDQISRAQADLQRALGTLAASGPGR